MGSVNAFEGCCDSAEGDGVTIEDERELNGLCSMNVCWSWRTSEGSSLAGLEGGVNGGGVIFCRTGVIAGVVSVVCETVGFKVDVLDVVDERGVVIATSHWNEFG